MLTRDDLDAAVMQGVITPAQSERILALAIERRNTRARTWVRDERFVFMKNFNEFFIAIGVVLLGCGLVAACATAPPLFFVYPLAMWGLAEYLTGHLRLTLPSIVTLLFLVVSVACLTFYLMAPDGYPEAPISFGWAFGTNIGIWSAIAALIVLSAHYWRFRLPFTLLLIPATIAWLVISVSSSSLINSFITHAVFVIVGLGAFAAAMAYDISDRERVTRRSDCAFWLNLIAAPLIVHPIASAIWARGDITASTAVLILMIVAVFGVIALAIDRRAMLVSSLGYLGGTLIHIVSSISGNAAASIWITLLVLGLFIVSLGVGWQKARASVLQLAPAVLHSWLPPARIG